MPEAREKWWKGKKGCKANRDTKDQSGAKKVTDELLMKEVLKVGNVSPNQANLRKPTSKPRRGGDVVDAVCRSTMPPMHAASRMAEV